MYRKILSLSWIGRRYLGLDTGGPRGDGQYGQEAPTTALLYEAVEASGEGCATEKAINKRPLLF